MDFKLNFSLSKKVETLYSGSFADKAMLARYILKNNHKVKNLKELCGEKPGRDECIHIITRNKLDSFSFVLYCLEEKPAIEMYVALYRIGDETFNLFLKLIEGGRIEKVCFVLNDAIEKLTPNVAMAMYEASKNNSNIRLKVINNHAKVICVRVAEDYYIIEGSGNWSKNARIEQYCFFNSKTLFDFHKGWMENVNTHNYAQL